MYFKLVYYLNSTLYSILTHRNRIFKEYICMLTVIHFNFNTCFFSKVNSLILLQLHCNKYIRQYYRYIYRGKSSISDPLLIPTHSCISITIRDINKLYIHELLGMY